MSFTRRKWLVPGKRQDNAAPVAAKEQQYLYQNQNQHQHQHRQAKQKLKTNNNTSKRPRITNCECNLQAWRGINEVKFVEEMQKTKARRGRRQRMKRKIERITTGATKCNNNSKASTVGLLLAIVCLLANELTFCQALQDQQSQVPTTGKCLMIITMMTKH